MEESLTVWTLMLRALCNAVAQLERYDAPFQEAFVCTDAGRT